MQPEFRAQLQRQEAACLRFLKQHHQYGGVTEEECRKLRAIILMISALGGGIHKGDAHYTTWYSRSIRHALGVVRSGLAAWVDKSCVVGFAILELQKHGSDSMQTVAESWEDLLETLQDPTDNDTVFYTMLLEHFNRLVFKPLLSIRSHASLKDPFDSEVYLELSAVYDALESVRDCAKHCDGLVEMLHQNLAEHREFLARDGRPCTPEEWEAHVWPQTPESSASNQAIPLLALPPPADAISTGRLKALSTMSAPVEANHALAVPTAVSPITVLPHELSKSFSAAEEAVARHGENSESDYIAAPIKKSESWSANSTVGHRRKGASVPRVFTGSMRHLERAIQKLDFNKVMTPDGEMVPPLPTNDHGPVKIRDFADSPSEMSVPSTPPCPRLDPLIWRSRGDDEAGGKETENEGPLLSKPPRKLKSSRSVTSSLEAWLTESSLAQKTYGLSPVKRSHLRQRENTI